LSYGAGSLRSAAWRRPLEAAHERRREREREQRGDGEAGQRGGAERPAHLGDRGGHVGEPLADAEHVHPPAADEQRHREPQPLVADLRPRPRGVAVERGDQVEPVVRRVGLGVVLPVALGVRDPVVHAHAGVEPHREVLGQTRDGLVARSARSNAGRAVSAAARTFWAVCSRRPVLEGLEEGQGGDEQRDRGGEHQRGEQAGPQAEHYGPWKR
jgi:hypothetical protein